MPLLLRRSDQTGAGLVLTTEVQMHPKYERVGKVRCPFHEEVTPSCVVDLRKRTFYCFGCEAEGFIQEV